MRYRYFSIVLLAFSVISCNSRSSSRVKIIGGEDATNNYGFFAGIYVSWNDDPIFLCGGSLIAEDIVLTAAHCLTDRSSTLQVAIGQAHHDNPDPSALRAVKAVSIHPDFDTASLENDIAILYFESKDGDAFKPISIRRDGIYPSGKDYLRVIGNGNISSFSSLYSDTLQQIDLPILSQEICLASEKSDADRSKTICAGYIEGGADSCQGDSGGPLFLPDETSPVLYGIVSFGSGCAQKQKPGYYTNVAAYVDWIAKEVDFFHNTNQLDTVKTFQSYCLRFLPVKSYKNAGSALIMFEDAFDGFSKWIENIAPSSLIEQESTKGQAIDCGDAIGAGSFLASEVVSGDAKVYKAYVKSANREAWDIFSMSFTRDVSFDCSDISLSAYFQNFQSAGIRTIDDYVFVYRDNNRNGIPLDAQEIASCGDEKNELKVYTLGQTTYASLKLASAGGSQVYKSFLPSDSDNFRIKLAVKKVEKSQYMLQVINLTTIDIYTWMLDCNFLYTLKTSDGLTISPESEKDYKGEYWWSALLKYSKKNPSFYSRIPAKSSLDFLMLLDRDVKSAPDIAACVVNGLPVDIQHLQ